MTVPGRRRVSIWDNMKTYDVSGSTDTGPGPQSRVKEAARHLLESLDTAKLKLPMLPQAASEAMQLAGDPSAGIRDIERVLRADPLIAARVLAVANSAMYGGTIVKTLQQALSRLGTGSIRDILYQAVSDAHIFRGDDAVALLAEREHALMVARATRSICQQIGFDSAYAFVCGLLHDIGRPIVHQLLCSDPPTLTPAERERLTELVHPVVGAKLARLWKLPSLVGEGCRRHHVYRDASRYSQIGNIIAAADRIGYHLGAGRRVRPLDLSQDAVFFELGMDPGGVMRVVTELETAEAA